MFRVITTFGASNTTEPNGWPETWGRLVLENAASARKKRITLTRK
jgi:hypothetical protein